MNGQSISPAPPPVRSGGPAPSWPHRALYDRVIDALHALPARFRTKLRIAGVAATDLFTLNTPLGAAIEQSVVDSLNELRPIWDPQDQYQQYNFVRQPQAFPDVRLQTTAPGASEPVLMGIELKGWFLLAKEGEPSFRYAATPAVCQPQDLLAIFPWQLDEVISGNPQLLRPFIEEARYAAEFRNHYWTVARGADSQQANGGVSIAPFQSAYPSKNDKYNDKPERDSGGNFGRVARGGFMTSFVTELMQTRLAGIPAKYWHEFFKAFVDGATEAAVAKALARIRIKVEGEVDEADAALRAVSGLAELIEQRARTSG